MLTSTNFLDSVDVSMVGTGYCISFDAASCDTYTTGLRMANFEYSLTSSGIDSVPEPSILALMGLGLAGIGFARRRKQA
jgi:hypothetical protein